jgi:hypothetical protein
MQNKKCKCSRNSIKGVKSSGVSQQEDGNGAGLGVTEDIDRQRSHTNISGKGDTKTEA